MSTKLQPVFDLITASLTDRALLTSANLQALGASREYVRKLVNAGRLERVTRGLYRLPGSNVTAHHSIAEATCLIPNGVVCLLSALRLHDVTTQSPFEVWMAVERGTWLQRPVVPPVRIIRPRGPAFHEGIEHIDMGGVDVCVYSLAKTVADCFKYRNKIGLDVALEALRESLKQKRVSIDDLWRYAKVCRVANVMRPYMEAME